MGVYEVLWRHARDIPFGVVLCWILMFRGGESYVVLCIDWILRENLFLNWESFLIFAGFWKNRVKFLIFTANPLKFDEIWQMWGQFLIFTANPLKFDEFWQMSPIFSATPSKIPSIPLQRSTYHKTNLITN